VQAQLNHLEYVCHSPVEEQQGRASPRCGGTPPALQQSRCSSQPVTHAGLSAQPPKKSTAGASPTRVHVQCDGPFAAAVAFGPPGGQAPAPSSPHNAIYQQLFAGIGARGIAHSPPRSYSGANSPAVSRAGTPSTLLAAGSGRSVVDRQVAETHCLIASIQDQIGQIKSSLAASSAEAGRSRVEQRLGQLEQNQRLMQSTDKYTVSLWLAIQGLPSFASPARAAL
jgi:hypothetical protein